MCGIGGVLKKKSEPVSDSIKKFEKLLLLSESRGKDASGLTIISDKVASIIRVPNSSKFLFETPEYKSELANILNSSETTSGFIGHTRLATNGSISDNTNNQPVVRDGICCIHNGVITNSEALLKSLNLKHNTSLDSEVIPAFYRFHLNQNLGLSEITSLFFDKVEGTASFACIFEDLNYLLLASNNGSLYFTNSADQFVFASQRNVVTDLLGSSSAEIFRLDKNNNSLVIQIDTLERKSQDNLNISVPFQRKFREVPLQTKIRAAYQTTDNPTEQAAKKLSQHHESCEKDFANIQRCSKCILPETFPFIQFNKNGVCNYCDNYSTPKLLGEEPLLNRIKSQTQNKNPKILVGLSGGRDSSYALHCVRQYFDNVYAFSYDWGVITDLARRNQSRMCEKLNVEHIFVAADLGKKRKNINLNVNAWLNRPNLGTIPLFMAGDKQYFYYANKIKEDYEIDAIVFGENLLETTFFKYGFCGISPKFDRKKPFHIDIGAKIKMLNFYLIEFIKNPHYFNRSLWDSFKGFLSVYFINHKYINLYDYLPWDEKEVNATLINKYNWEIDPEYPSTWRIGDGTAALYNLIYFSFAGFSELDTFRSNQIRNNVISRAEALDLVRQENILRIQALKWYFDTMNLDFVAAVDTIIDCSKIYRKNLLKLN